jgi:tRNA pseudouridine38-40 synthase
MPERLRIDLAYDGAPFAGFARQPDQRTVQGELEQACTGCWASRCARSAPGAPTGACTRWPRSSTSTWTPRCPAPSGRSRSLDIFADALDGVVGRAITIWRVRRVGPDFDARFSAIGRAYRYRLADEPRISPLVRHDRWHVGERLDVPAMRAAARELLGEHDFASFCRRAPGRTTVRRLDAVTVARRGGEIAVGLRGPAFCHQQVRSIVGCLVEVGRGRRQPDWLAEVLAARDRATAARVAPPHGLVLERVSYGRRWPAGGPGA